ncbi:MAG: type II toxin-antitoxin system RelE/ParE family toxin [Deltaproteobacteria bacterium]
MNIVQTRYFGKSYKKLHVNEIKPVNDAIRYILSDPQCGEEKKGDLAGVLVYKFRVQDQQFLLAYEYDKENLFLLALGVHENFYRDLKKARS